jgi:hypothetical protein
MSLGYRASGLEYCFMLFVEQALGMLGCTLNRHLDMACWWTLCWL